jgi:hypothetical protein
MFSPSNIVGVIDVSLVVSLSLFSQVLPQSFYLSFPFASFVFLERSALLAQLVLWHEI